MLPKPEAASVLCILLSSTPRWQSKTSENSFPMQLILLPGSSQTLPCLLYRLSPAFVWNNCTTQSSLARKFSLASVGTRSYFKERTGSPSVPRRTRKGFLRVDVRRRSSATHRDNRPWYQLENSRQNVQENRWETDVTFLRSVMQIWSMIDRELLARSVWVRQSKCSITTSIRRTVAKRWWSLCLYY